MRKLQIASFLVLNFIRNLKIISIVILTILFNNIAISQNVELTTQGEVNGFDQTITVLSGDLTISGVTIRDLSPLSNLTSISGKLHIGHSDNLTNLGGLENLTSIGGELIIFENYSLSNLYGLSNLTSIGYRLRIYNNRALTNLNGFSNLTSIDENLLIYDNVALTNIDGFSNLTSIGVDLYIYENPALTNIEGFSNLTSIGGHLTIFDNPALTSIGSMANLTSIGGYLYICNNAALTTIGSMANLTSIGGHLSICSNAALTTIGSMVNLTSIGDYLYIIYNEALTNLDGLANLATINGLLYIGYNDALTNIDGLANLTSINGYLHIEYNYALTNIDGLANLTSISSFLNIGYNASLATIDGFENLTYIGGDLSISPNPALTTIDGFENLSSIRGDLSISLNPALTNIDSFGNLTSIGGDLYIGYNAVLTNIDGFENLISLDILNISYNDALTSINGFENLTSIVDMLWISDNAALTNIDGFENLTSIVGKLVIRINPSLTVIDGMSNLTSIGDYLWVVFNDDLKNIDGFEKLTSIGDDLWITYNDDLTNIDGIENLISIGGKLDISNNSSLSNCCGIQHLLTTPGAIGGSINIFGNPSECSSQEEIESASCKSCWETGGLQFCLSSEAWEPVSGQQNKIQATDIISVNDFLHFDGTMTIDTTELEITASGEFYVTDIPLPGGSIGKYSLSKSTSFSLLLLGNDATIIDFININVTDKAELFGVDLTIDNIQLVKKNDTTGLKISCTIEIPGISGSCGSDINNEILLNGIEITPAGISLGGVNVEDLGLYVPGFCLKELSLNYDAPKDILTSVVDVKLPFGEVAGGFKLDNGEIDSIGWKQETNISPFVLGNTTIGIKGFFGHISNITKPAIEVELGGIFSDIDSDDLYRVTAAGKTVWPTYFQVDGFGQFMRPILNTLPFQLQGGVSMGYNIPNKLFSAKVNGNFGTLDNVSWLMSGNALVRISHRLPQVRFKGNFIGQMHASEDLFGTHPPMPISYVASVMGFPFDIETKNIIHYGNNKKLHGYLPMTNSILDAYRLYYLIDISKPLDHKDYFNWWSLKRKSVLAPIANKTDVLLGNRTELINVPDDIAYTIFRITSEATVPTSMITSPSGKQYLTSSEEDKILYSVGTNNNETFWTIILPEQGTWMVDLEDPASTDSVFYYLMDEENEFQFTVDQQGSTVMVSWDVAQIESGQLVNVLLDDDNANFDGFFIAEGDASEGSLSFTLDENTPDCKYYLYAELIEEIRVQQSYADQVIDNSLAALAPPQKFKATYVQATDEFDLSWEEHQSPEVAGYILTVTDDIGNDSVYAVLHPTDTSIRLLIEDFEHKSIRIESYDQEWSIGCPSVLDTLTTSCILPSTELVESICEGEIYEVGTSSYATSGNYTDILLSSEDCDSIVNLTLTITEVNNIISEENGTLIAEEDNASYQWIDCDSGNDIIGANQQSYIPTSTGNFAVRITKDDCEETSTCLYFIVTAIKELEATGVSLSPNPANNWVMINNSENRRINPNVIIVDAFGRNNNLAISSDMTINTSELVPGLYQIVLTIDGEVYSSSLIILR